ncbi:hypothetical protein HCA61_22145 [Rhodococcus sp. HNM0563]|uniref:hypothetical protein n=1 Tax=Rhodococcus sp. HNM0563 TaxID=2716339 RepID=UPI00146DF3CB|nr:hypothetical protein [Rhodococcus sp. HNM0563]NLU64942.1 hypothetical protein [Rhodococcus sp. HNM0563]
MSSGVRRTSAVSHREVNTAIRRARAIADRFRKRDPDGAGRIDADIVAASKLLSARDRERTRPCAFLHAVLALNFAEELEDRYGLDGLSTYAASELIGLIGRTLRIEVPADMLSAQLRAHLNERNAALLHAQRGTLADSDLHQRRLSIRAARYALAITNELREDLMRPASASTSKRSPSASPSRSSSDEPRRVKEQKRTQQKNSKNTHRGSRSTKQARTDDMPRGAFGLRAKEVERLRKNAREQLPAATSGSSAVHRNPRATAATKGVGHVVSGGLPGTSKGH